MVSPQGAPPTLLPFLSFLPSVLLYFPPLHVPLPQNWQLVSRSGNQLQTETKEGKHTQFLRPLCHFPPGSRTVMWPFSSISTTLKCTFYQDKEKKKCSRKEWNWHCWEPEIQRPFKTTRIWVVFQLLFSSLPNFVSSNYSWLPLWPLSSSRSRHAMLQEILLSPSCVIHG